MNILLLALLTAGTCDCPVVTPAHFVDVHGNTLENLEPCWAHLHAFFGEATPDKIIVEYSSEDGSQFDTRRNAVHISTSIWAMAPQSIVAHESAHLALNRLTAGASSTEPFRFLDEGLAEYLEQRLSGDFQFYRQEVLAVTAIDQAAGKLSFAAMREWSTYFGRPPNRNLRAYAAGATVIIHLVERFGAEKLRGFFVELGRTRDLDKAARKGLGLSAAKLEADWSAWIKSHKPADEANAEPLRIVRMSPANGSTEVSTELREIELELSKDMFSRSPLCLSTPCRNDICYVDQYWKSPRVFAIRAPEGLRPGTDYTIVIGSGGCLLESRDGERLPVTRWEFSTK